MSGEVARGEGRLGARSGNPRLRSGTTEWGPGAEGRLGDSEKRQRTFGASQAESAATGCPNPFHACFLVFTTLLL